MTMEVRSLISLAMASWMSCSVSVSMLEVASSRTRISGSKAKARAKANSWRWPADRVEPPSATAWAKPWGRRSMKGAALT